MTDTAAPPPSTRDWNEYRNDLLTVAREGDHDWMDDADIRRVLQDASRSGMQPGLLISCQAAVEARQASPVPVHTEKTRILVIDDEQRNCDTLKAMLEQAGFEVRTEVRSENFRSAIAEFRPDLLLLDMVMPDVDGPAILQSLSEDGATRSLPVIVLTGLLLDSPLAAVNRTGLLYLAKPLGPKSLIHCINQHLTGAAARSLK